MGEIRDVEKSDVAGLTGILDQTHEFSRRDIACCKECLHDSYEGVQPSYRFICAEDGGIDGFACYDSDSLADGVVEVYWVAVAPHKRKNGVGKQLLGHIESCARREKARMMVVETESGPLYESARRLYEKCGFSREAVLKDFYRKGDDKEIYVKRLD